jgi:hypothetical protein
VRLGWRALQLMREVVRRPNGDYTYGEVDLMNTPTRMMLALTPIVLLGQTAEAQTQRPLMYSLRQCNENAIEFRLDPRPFQDIVGPELSLALEEGRARVVIIAHDCSQYWIDGQDVGPAQDVRIWVTIRGLDDVRPVVGAERTLPTRTYFALLEGSSNPRVREAKIASGASETSVDSVVLVPPGTPGEGRVLLGGGLAFSWRVPSPAAPSARLVGLNLDVYRRDSTGAVVLNRIQALMHVSADPSPGTLDVVGRAGVVPLLRPGVYPASVRIFFPMWSRATQGLAPSR